MGTDKITSATLKAKKEKVTVKLLPANSEEGTELCMLLSFRDTQGQISIKSVLKGRKYRSRDG